MSGDSILVEELLFVLQVDEDQPSDPVYITAQVDLAPFNFSEAELQKLRQLARRLEFALLDALSQETAAASVIVEVRSTDSATR